MGESRRIFIDSDRVESPACAILMGNYWCQYERRGNLTQAVECHEEGIRIRTVCDNLTTPCGAEAIAFLGKAKLLQKDFVGAMKAFEEAKRIHLATFSLDTQQGEQLMSWIAICNARGNENGSSDASSSSASLSPRSSEGGGDAAHTAK